MDDTGRPTYVEKRDQHLAMKRRVICQPSIRTETEEKRHTSVPPYVRKRHCHRIRTDVNFSDFPSVEGAVVVSPGKVDEKKIHGGV